MAIDRHARRPGLREVSILWGLCLLVAAEIFATYARLPAQELYHVSQNGRGAGASRTLVFLNWPVALVAIPILAVVAADARSRVVSRLSILAAILCAAVFWPGVVDQSNLDAKWSNAIAATGVLLALGLTVVAVVRHGLGPRGSAAGDRARLVIVILLILVSLPWLAADLGFLIGRWPLLGSVYYSDEWYAPFGHARAHRAVHAGDHHGGVGALLVVTALLLSRRLATLGPRMRTFVGAYLAVLGLYGLANVANDFWLEQIVKRGITHWEFPSMTVPAPTIAWLVLLTLAAIVYALLVRRAAPPRPVGDRPPLWAAGAAPAFVALLAVGLAHSGAHRQTPLGSADGIAFAAAPSGTSHIFVTRAGHIVQLTNSNGSDLAPAWSPDHRHIAFQSNRDGNWEIYVMRADGTGTRRLTRDDARDGEPSWSPGGEKIAFTHDGNLFAIGSDGRHMHSLQSPGEWPTWSPKKPDELASDVPYGDHDYGLVLSAPGQSLGQYGSADNRRPSWSPDGRRVAFECRRADHWRICVIDRSGRRLRILTEQRSNAFAPAWAPDGNRIAFISDRDGTDQLFVMRADGTGVVRLTSGLAEKDTPAWARR